MPLRTLAEFGIATDEIVVDVSDTVVDSTRYKNRAHITGLNVNYNSKTVSILFDIVPYSDLEGEYGIRIDGEDFIVKKRELTADNGTLVKIDFSNNSESGKIIGPVSLLKEDPEHLLDGIDYMKEYDFFTFVSSQPVVVRNLIVQTLLRAVQRGQL